MRSMWIVTGGRDFDDADLVAAILSRAVAQHGAPDIVLYGSERGADWLATEWFCQHTRARVELVPARWDLVGRRAGPMRNAAMLERLREHLVGDGRTGMLVAFPGGTGTADMVRRAKQAGVTVLHVAA